jgi:hypothetical protein
MHNPEISRSLAASPLRAALVEALKRPEGEHRRPNGQPKSEYTYAIEDGKTHPCLPLDRRLCEARDGGASLAWALGVADAVRDAIVAMWHTPVEVPDFDDAMELETAAQGATDVIQCRAGGPRRDCAATLAELESRLAVEIVAKETAKRAAAARRRQIEENRAAARRGLGLAG